MGLATHQCPASSANEKLNPFPKEAIRPAIEDDAFAVKALAESLAASFRVDRDSFNAAFIRITNEKTP